MKYYFLIFILIFTQLRSFALIEDAGVLMAPECYSKETYIDENQEDLSINIYMAEQQRYIDQKYGSSNSCGYLNSPKKSHGGGDVFDRNY